MCRKQAFKKEAFSITYVWSRSRVVWPKTEASIATFVRAGCEDDGGRFSIGFEAIQEDGVYLDQLSLILSRGASACGMGKDSTINSKSYAAGAPYSRW